MQLFVKSRKIRLAGVGCGYVFQKHLKAIIHHHKNLELKAICDNNRDKIKFLKENFLSEIGFEKDEINALQIFNSFEDLIQNIKKKKVFVDIIILCTPSGLHVKEAIEAANAGINVITEKPMALRLEDGIKMVKKFNKEKLKLFVVKQNRFNDALKLLKNQVEAKKFGRISVVSINVFWHRSQQYYDKDAWRGTKLLDGGALINQSSHYIDLLIWLFGDVESVFAQNSTLGRKIEVEDTSLLQFKWVNGILGNMAITMLSYKENYEASITVIGDKGIVKIGGKALNKIESWSFSDADFYVNSLNKINKYKKEIPFKGHIPYYQNIINFFRGAEEKIVDGMEGLRSLELIEASYLSANESRQIYLPLFNRENFN